MSVNKSLTFIETEVRKEDQVNSSNIDNFYCYRTIMFKIPATPNKSSNGSARS